MLGLNKAKEGLKRKYEAGVVPITSLVCYWKIARSNSMLPLDIA